MTLVVLAHPNDSAATRLVQRWQPHGARLMRPRDLSRPGWRMYVGGQGEEWFVADGERCRTAALRGVLTRLPLLDPAGLSHLHAGDREYVAAEMTAFLIAWLTKLKVPVLNTPTTSSLCGASLAPERLLALAERCGIPTFRRFGGPHEADAATLPFPETTVTVVGERWFGTAPAALAAQTVRLARTAGLQLMTAQYGGIHAAAGGTPPLLGAEPLVDTDNPAIAQAVLAMLEPQHATA